MRNYCFECEDCGQRIISEHGDIPLGWLCFGSSDRGEAEIRKKEEESSFGIVRLRLDNRFTFCSERCMLNWLAKKLDVHILTENEPQKNPRTDVS